MVIVTKYKCAICKTEYKSPESAMGCEQSHMPWVQSFVEYTQGRVYPTRVALKMPDGSVLVFDRKC